MKNTKTNIGKILSLLFAFLVLVSSLVFAATFPSAPSSITYVKNETNAYPNGTIVNYTRGYIYTLDISESQPTIKWVGYVGNIQGEYALQDSKGYALYDWNIVTITGEIYATAESDANGVDIVGDDSSELNTFTWRFQGGIPYWPNMTCANGSMIVKESYLWGHTNSMSESPDEDDYNMTFMDAGFTLASFYVGEKLVNDTLVSPCGLPGRCATTGGQVDTTRHNKCMGMYLKSNDQDPAETTTSVRNWTEVVLTDNSYEVEGDFAETGDHQYRQYDIIYAALLENDSIGYNGSTFDFQIMLPQNGSQAEPVNIAYYFYIELV